jgi:CrcB protein
MIQTFLVFLGGGIGAAGRHGVNVAAARLFGLGFPWGTLIVNVAGSFAMGLLAAWFAFRAGSGLSQHARLFLATGILGGFTTFSAFSLDAVLLWERGAVAAAASYVIGSVAVSIGGLFAGLALVRAFS